MVANVQCPVCTLYLHAGMNLSDHLETHPKEQVIKALVQMTISGGGGGAAALASVLTNSNNSDNKKNKEAGGGGASTDVKPIIVEDNISKSIAVTKTPATTTPTVATTTTPTVTATTTPTVSVTPGTAALTATTSKSYHDEFSSFTSASMKYMKTTSSANTATTAETVVAASTISSFSNATPATDSLLNTPFKHKRRIESAASAAAALPLKSVAVESTDQSNQQQNIRTRMNAAYQTFFSDSNATNQHYEQPQFSLQQQHVTATGVSQLQTQTTVNLQRNIVDTSASLLPPPPMSNIHVRNNYNGTLPQTTPYQHQQQNPRHQIHQQHQQQQQQQQQQQTNLKLVYSPALPPPPPLQLFTQQSPQHQKPPPAYGTAISQIRSQHNQNRQQHQQQHQHQQLQQQQITLHQISPSMQSSVALPTSTNKHHLPQVKNKYDGDAEPFISLLPPAQQQPLNTQFSHAGHHSTLPTHVSPNVAMPMSPSLLSQKIIPLTNSPSALTRQTSSPMSNNSIGMAAAPSPSPSVLRYAESPVAHYLERDNGDFIVQETPKHIVECVEKDNGEFSVIERIYHSPPSVLHIHDDEDDDGDDEEEEFQENVTANSSKSTPTKSSTKKRQTKTLKKHQNSGVSVGHNKKSMHKKSHSNQFDDDEFMSLTSGSESDTEDECNTTIGSSSSISTKASLNQTSDGRVKITNQQQQNQQTMSPLSTAPSTSAAAAALNTSCSNESSTSSSNIGQQQVARKSKKNTITVLSDVPLNMNEYLDLVGNILASNKFTNQRPYAAIAPVPVVKVEKEEPVDEYDARQHNYVNHEGGASQNTSTKAEPATRSMQNTIPPVIPNANENETDDFVVNNNKQKYDDQKPPTIDVELPQEQQQHHQQHTPSLIQEASTCNSGSGSSSSNHVTTSVIRMATTTATSQQPQQQQQQVHQGAETDTQLLRDPLEIKHTVPEDLTQPLMKIEVEPTSLTPQTFPPPPLKQRGPKKLIIKPKSTPKKTQKTDNGNVASTSNAAASTIPRSDDIIYVKNEPITNAYDGPPSSNSILENHLKSSTSSSSSTLKVESGQNNTNMSELEVINTNAEDARVLLEFANSKQHSIPHHVSTSSAAMLTVNNSGESIQISSMATEINSISNFPSAGSVFSTNNTIATICNPNTGHSTKRVKSEEYILPDNDLDEIVISSSSYSSHSASDVVATQQQEQQQTHLPVEVISGHGGHSSHNFNDFNFLYNPASVTPYVVGANTKVTSNFSPFAYQQHHAHDATTAATIATSTSASSAILEDSLSGSSRSRLLREQQSTISNAATAGSSWYQLQQSADFNPALAVDCSAAIDGVADVDGSKYLDLDTCKRENISGSNSHATSNLLPPSSASSSASFIAAGTECSLAGGCTVDALNIRTDEKMPAKGEISEQESNCDIENSWSQSMYCDMSSRLFRTSFPGAYAQDNGWHHDQYFPAQDLSIANGANDQKPIKSFDFRLPMEGTTSTIVTQNMQIYPQNNDSIPSTSKASKNKRKRATQMPTSTITSQQMMFQQQQLQQQQQLMQQHQHHHNHLELHDSQPTTSAALLANPPNELTAVLATGSPMNSLLTPVRRQRKVYKCDHCHIVFRKLKDRTAHLVGEHNYIRRNRRLVCVQSVVTSTITSIDMGAAAAAMVASSSGNIMPTLSPPATMLLPPPPPHQGNADEAEDLKHHIVKIKMEHCSDQQQHQQQQQQQINNVIIEEEEQQHQSLAALTISENKIEAKTEDADVKDSSLTSAASTSGGSTIVPHEHVVAELDTKPNLQSTFYGKHIPASKLAALYRMLTGYNISKLKQGRPLSELEQKVMENSILLCYVCRTDFPSVKLYDAHLTEHPAECFTCGKKFYRWKNFSLHLKRHLGWKEFGCYVCDKKFVVRSALVEHMRMHTGQTPLKCGVCGKRFKRYSNLTQHRKRHTRQIVRKKEYVCHCGEVLPSKARYLWHKETHDSKPKCCPYCCDRFIHANSLRRHIRLAHSDKFDYTEPMECPMCKQVFAKTSIKAHMATHSMGTQYDCVICNKSFSTKWNLKMHSWVHANRTAKPFKCEHCPKAFVRELDFKNHMNSHKQIKPYTCEYCGCKFIRKYNYMRHRREHHGNKKFTCDLCDKSFHRHYYLIEHRRIHTGERPFQCTICGKSSTTKTNHNKHLKIHHSRDPFTVEV